MPTTEADIITVAHAATRPALRQIFPAILFAGWLAAMPSAPAAPAHTPPNLPGAHVITAEEAHKMAKQGVPLYDVRVGHEYAEEHIKGAISLPYKERSAKRPDYDPAQDQFDLAKLPVDKTKPVIFYCNAGECWKSYKAGKAALGAGYKEVYWLRGGIPEWKQKKLPVE